MSLLTSHSYQVKANTVDVSSSIDWSSIDHVEVLTKEVSTFKFNVKLYGSKYVPAVGDQIDAYETDSSLTTYHRFGGTITEIETTIQGLLKTAQVTATDWGYKMDGKLIVASYTNMDPADIIAAIVPAGFDATTYVQRAGFTIASIKFNYLQPTKCIQKLATLLGWQWYIDADKKVHFFLAESNNAPFPIDDTTGGVEFETIDVDVNLQNMKNSVFVIGGVQKVSFTPTNEVDVYLGDGTQTNFPLRYAYTDATCAVALNGVAQTVGLANQVTDITAFDCIYDRTNKTVTFNTPPPNGQVIEVLGVAEIPIVAHAIDPAAITAYGEFQDAIFDSQIKTTEEAHMRAQAEILLFGHAVYDVKFYTRTPGLRIGQNIVFNSTKFGVSNYPLVIKRIEGRGNLSGEIRYQVECIGSDNVTFVDIMSTILQQENSQTQVDNVTLEVLLPVPEATVGVDALHAPTSTTGPYFVGTTAVVGFFTMG